MAKRQEQVLHYLVQGLGPDQIAPLLGVDRNTAYRDFQAVELQLNKRVEMAQLYTVQKAFAGLNEEWVKAWEVFNQPKEKRMVMMGDEVAEVELDDSFRKLHALNTIHKVTELRCKLAGYFSPKVLERITMVETTQGRGVRIERLTYDEQINLRVDRLRGDEGLARSEGIDPADLR